MNSLLVFQLLSTLAVVIGHQVVASITRRLLAASAEDKGVPSKRAYYLQAYFRVLLLFVALITVALIWSVDFRGLLVFASSLFAVVGVALFAQWSMLSNITASIIIFFSFPHRIGDTIKILDGENTVVGTIQEITLFQVLMVNPEGELVSYPNNLLLQRPVVRIKALLAAASPATSEAVEPSAQPQNW